MIKKALLSIFGLLILACGGDNPTVSQLPTLSDMEYSANLNINDTLYVSVMVTDPQGAADIDSVWGLFGYLDSLNSYDSVLFNDIGIDGDSDSGDGRYSIKISPPLGGFQRGYYRLRVQVADISGNLSGWLEEDIWFDDDNSPVLSDIVYPVNLNIDDTLYVSVMVTDPQGLADIDSVWGLFVYLEDQNDYDTVLFNDGGVDGDSVSGDGRYSIKISPPLGGFQLGYYILRVQAADTSGNLSGWLENAILFDNGSSPVLFDPVAPDSIQRGSPTPSYITVGAYDPDGLSDIDSVYIITIRPDSTSSGGHFYMADDGVTYEDEVANDGIYTIGIVTDVANQLGDYTFTFYAIDSNENQSNNPFVIITVY
ncbi:MAG: hypothetical protein V3W18_14585 [candidate division Zixibacteria bacterium]